MLIDPSAPALTFYSILLNSLKQITFLIATEVSSRIKANAPAYNNDMEHEHDTHFVPLVQNLTVPMTAEAQHGGGDSIGKRASRRSVGRASAVAGWISLMVRLALGRTVARERLAPRPTLGFQSSLFFRFLQFTDLFTPLQSTAHRLYNATPSKENSK